MQGSSAAAARADPRRHDGLRHGRPDQQGGLHLRRRPRRREDLRPDGRGDGRRNDAAAGPRARRHAVQEPLHRGRATSRPRPPPCSEFPSSRRARSPSPPRIRCGSFPAWSRGSAVAGAISIASDVRLLVPHGGVFVLVIPNAVTHLGSATSWRSSPRTLVTAAALYLVKRPVEEGASHLAPPRELRTVESATPCSTRG